MSQIQITDKFSDDTAIAAAYRASDSALGFLTVWSTIAKRVLQSGKIGLRGFKIKELSTTVEIGAANETKSFVAMLENSMVKYPETEVVPSTLGDSQYEEWYKAYPYRIVNGRKVKVRGKSKIRFTNSIRNLETFQQLMAATAVYSKMCNKLPKDPERFLKDDFWKEYLPDAVSAMENSATSRSTSALDSDAVNKLLA